jgi:hypothetical protein
MHHRDTKKNGRWRRYRWRIYRWRAWVFRISRQAALKELGKLIGHNLIALQGKGRGARYVLA